MRAKHQRQFGHLDLFLPKVNFKTKIFPSITVTRKLEISSAVCHSIFYTELNSIFTFVLSTYIKQLTLTTSSLKVVSQLKNDKKEK